MMDPFVNENGGDREGDDDREGDKYKGSFGVKSKKNHGIFLAKYDEISGPSDKSQGNWPRNTPVTLDRDDTNTKYFIRDVIDDLYEVHTTYKRVRGSRLKLAIADPLPPGTLFSSTNSDGEVREGSICEHRTDGRYDVVVGNSICSKAPSLDTLRPDQIQPPVSKQKDAVWEPGTPVAIKKGTSDVQYAFVAAISWTGTNTSDTYIMTDGEKVKREIHIRLRYTSRNHFGGAAPTPVLCSLLLGGRLVSVIDARLHSDTRSEMYSHLLNE